MPETLAKTTIKISQRVINFVLKHAREGEPIDNVLRRLLGLKQFPYVPPRNCMMKLVKVSGEVMNLIKDKAKESESRDQTLGRLLGISGDYGNVLKKNATPSMPSLPQGRSNVGNVRKRT